MDKYQYDLFVIGAGSAGVRASRMSAQYGARVAIAEDTYMGGTCVNVGCVPKKLLMYAGNFSELFRDAVGYGWDASVPELDWRRLIENKNNEINRLNNIYTNLLEGSGVAIFRATARFLDPHTLQVGERVVTAENILIATGSWPWVPEFPGNEHAITSNEVFFLDQLPASITIVGGGYIASEFASIFNGLGVKVNLVYRGELFLRGFDFEMRQHLASEMEKKGITLYFNSEISHISPVSSGLEVVLRDGRVLHSEKVLYATGRRPRTAALNLEATGVLHDSQGYIEVDGQFRTSTPNIYAIGDVIGGPELTPVALAQGMAVAKALFKGELIAAKKNALVPTAIFTQPSLACVGLSEDDARAQGIDIAIFTAKFTQLRHTVANNSEKTLMKLVVDKSSDRVLGAHMVGPDAAEIIQGLAVAINAGATKADFDTTLGIHPSAAEEFVTMRNATR